MNRCLCLNLVTGTIFLEIALEASVVLAASTTCLSVSFLAPFHTHAACRVCAVDYSCGEPFSGTLRLTAQILRLLQGEEKWLMSRLHSRTILVNGSIVHTRVRTIDCSLQREI